MPADSTVHIITAITSYEKVKADILRSIVASSLSSEMMHAGKM